MLIRNPGSKQRCGDGVPAPAGSHVKICVFAFRICIGIDTDPAPGSQINADPNLNQASLYTRSEALHFSVTFSQQFSFLSEI
jgi:hypothetical protein